MEEEKDKAGGGGALPPVANKHRSDTLAKLLAAQEGKESPIRVSQSPKDDENSEEGSNPPSDDKNQEKEEGSEASSPARKPPAWKGQPNSADEKWDGVKGKRHQVLLDMLLTEHGKISARIFKKRVDELQQKHPGKSQKDLSESVLFADGNPVAKTTPAEVLPKDTNSTETFEIILHEAGPNNDNSNSNKEEDDHPVLTSMIESYVDHFYEEGGPTTKHSSTVDLVIYRLFMEHSPSLVLVTGPTSTTRAVLFPEQVLRGGPQYSLMVQKIRDGFVRAYQKKHGIVAAAAPVAASTSTPPPATATTTTQGTSKPKADLSTPEVLMCEEDIDPFEDPALERANRDRQEQVRRQQMGLLQPRQPEIPIAPAATVGAAAPPKPPPPPPATSTVTVDAEPAARPKPPPPLPATSSNPPVAQPGSPSKKPPPEAFMEARRRPGAPMTPNRGVSAHTDATPVMANTTGKTARGAAHRPLPFASPRPPTVGGDKKTTTGVAKKGVANKKRKPKEQNKTKRVSKKAKRAKRGPMVTPKGLTYDWSSLELNGTASWNRILKQRMLDDPVAHPTVPQVNALDTYQLMQNLKNSLRTIPPPRGSPLPEALRRILAPSSRQVAQDFAQGRRVRLSTTAPPPPPPASCPNDLRHLYPRMAKVYQEMVAQDSVGPADSFLQRSYQYMTASEMRQHMITAEQDIAKLAVKEERVLRTAEKLGLWGDDDDADVQKKNSQDKELTEDEGDAGGQKKKPVFWQKNFSALLKSGDPATRYLMAHDQF